ncbi:NlpC/P60 family protein [Pyxidicoccus xibeiensis]|uniref:NlpC/P60 family protein n=1 Tax=Pyxidicoccus xibeiensis TaxID=2906759 RepID=UPI0020A6F5D6|nr:NlpC/P60 family protein [Pyxidicoccus xibeiensis]MCP3139736.1 CHAP domain-containing protein [Pyxidicoccus xibeiensis]
MSGRPSGRAGRARRLLYRAGMHRGVWVGAVVGMLLWGGAAEAARKSAPKRQATVSLAERAVWRAKNWVGLRSLSTVSTSVNDDCSGLTQLAYRKPGLSLMPERTLPGENGVKAIYRKAGDLGTLRETPRAGDMVFFRNTHDRNRDGRLNDGLTHIGIVERVGADGTVTFVHRAGNGVKRGHFNLARPDARKDEKGRILNDWLRRRDKRNRGYLAGELVAGFASVDERWKSTPAPFSVARAKVKQR